MKPLKLEILFGSRDSLSPALKLMIGNSNAAAAALKRTRDEIKRLNDQQKQIDGYVRQKKATEDSAKALKDMQDRIRSLRQQMASNPTAELTRDFDKATKQAKQLKDAHQRNQQQLQTLRNELNQAGMSTNNLSQHQSDLRRRTDQATGELDRQRQSLRNLNTQQQQYQRSSQRLRSAGMTGIAMAGAGVAGMYQLRKPIDESKRVDVESNRIHALGLGDETSKKAIKFAQAMDTFGTSIYDNMVLVRDGMTIFSDLHHAEMVAPTLAKMKFGNQAMFGHEKGEENERAFMDMLKVIELRGGLKSEKAFQDQANKIQQVITATGGRVQGSEWLNAIKTGGIAVKGLSDEALYYKMESIVQEWGGFRYGTAAMSAYQNIYQGRTTKRAANNMQKLGLIEDPSKLKHDKSGQISFLDVGAIKGADIFKKDQFAWMEQVLLPQLAAKGITEKGDVLDAIGSIFTNRTASNLFGDMYLQRDIIKKSAKMNAGADNVDQLYTKAKGTAAGEELETKAKLHDAYLRFGQTILPIYVSALQTATKALQGFTHWMQQNPALANLLGKGLLVVAAGLIAIGGILVIFSPLILGMLSLRLMMVTLGAQGTALSFVMRMLVSPFKMIGAAAMWLGRIVMIVGRMMLANPIILAITLIATAAYLIYQNWEPIKAFFLDLWTGISSGAQTLWSNITAIFTPLGVWFASKFGEMKAASSLGISGISALILNWSPIGLFYSAFAAVLSWFGIELPAKFTTFGGNIIDGLVNGIKAGFAKLKAIWNEVTSFVPSFFTKKMDIHSPSRVMAGLGGYVIDGIGVGLIRAFPALQQKYQQVVDIFSPKARPPILDQVDIAKPMLGRINNNTPNVAANRQSSVAVAGDTYTIHIHAAPGQNANDLEQQIMKVFERIQRNKEARFRTILADQE